MKTAQCNKCNAVARLLTENQYHEVYRCVSCRAIIEVNHEQPVNAITFSCFNHQNKAGRLIAALESKYEQVATNGGSFFCLTDSDVSGRAMQLKRMASRGTRRFFVYPHAARPSLINSYYPTWDGLTAQMVVNDCHAEVLREYGYSKPLISIGWYLSDVEAFKGRNTDGRAVKVLFAPIHPRNAQQDRDANKAAFDRLYNHVMAGEIELTVRHIGELIESGLEEKPLVKYVNGAMNQTTNDMDNADVVIAHQTFAWLAVARGIPCVMFAEDMPTHFRNNNQYYDAPHWDKVAHLFRYPLDLLCENDTMKLLGRAAQSDDEIADWRRRMIGAQFDPAAFAEKVNEYL